MRHIPLMTLFLTQKLIEFIWSIGTLIYIPLVFAYACYAGYHHSEGSFFWGLGVFVFTGFLAGLIGEWTLNLLHLMARSCHAASIWFLPKDEREYVQAVLATRKEQQQ